jgi:hypothetical protein
MGVVTRRSATGHGEGPADTEGDRQARNLCATFEKVFTLPRELFALAREVFTPPREVFTLAREAR